MPISVEAPRARVDESWTTSIESANDPDQLSLDPDIRIELRRIGRVRRLEADLVLLLEEALEGHGVRAPAGLLDLGDHDVAVSGGRLWADEDEIPVRDVGLDHRIAADAKNVCVAARGEEVWDRHGFAGVLIRLDRATGRDFADDRQHVRLRRGRLRDELARETEPDGRRGRQ